MTVDISQNGDEHIACEWFVEALTRPMRSMFGGYDAPSRVRDGMLFVVEGLHESDGKYASIECYPVFKVIEMYQTMANKQWPEVSAWMDPLFANEDANESFFDIAMEIQEWESEEETR